MSILPEPISLKQFENEARNFLDSNAAKKTDRAFVWGEGDDDVSLFSENTPEQEQLEVRSAKEFARKVFDAGFGWITGPSEFGGRELPKDYQTCWEQLRSEYEIPSDNCRGIGLGMVAPTILAHGTPLVKKLYLSKLYRGDIIACQLFSEPIAGSDLAGIQTKASKDGDQWIINGQKVWTSGAQYSDIGEIICRTNNDVPKHKGLTVFVVDMKAKGVEIRPLKQMTGGATFNEIFFNDVVIADSHRLGEIDGGWTVALTTLMNERAAIGSGGGGISSGSMSSRMLEMIKHFGADDEPLVRQLFVEIYINSRIASFTSQRALAKLTAGKLPGPEMSIGKLSLTENLRRIGDLCSLVLGPKLVANSGEWGTYAWSQIILGTPGLRVAGGTDEIMRNIISERVLGLPK